MFVGLRDRQALGINDLLQFEFVSPPSRAAIVAALEQLFNLGAVSDLRSSLTDWRWRHVLIWLLVRRCVST